MSGLKEGGWKRENEGKCEWWSKGIESTRDGEGMRGACEVARAQEVASPGANSGAGAKCASQGQEMVFDEEGVVVGRVRGFAQAGHLHRGEQRWTLDGTPLSERETVCDRNGNNTKMYNETLRPILHSVYKQPPAGNSHLHRRANRWAAPKSHRSKSCSPAYLTVSRSSTHSSPATTGGRIVIEMLLQG